MPNDEEASTPGIPPSLSDNPERYARIGADGEDEGMYVRFDHGFGMNVIIGFRAKAIKTSVLASTGQKFWDGKSYENQDFEGPGRGMIMGLDGWEKLCTFVDEYRARLGKKPGLWVVYAYDNSPYPIKCFEEEIDAYRYRDDLAYGYVKFWEAGTEWREVKE